MRPYYESGGITIYHGDCREILPTLERFDALVSDPPYGMAYRHGARKGGVKWGMDGESIVGDDVPFDPSHLWSSAAQYILWGGNHYADKLPASRGWLVWQKRDADTKDQSDAELAWTNVLSTVRTFSRRWDGSVRGGREQAEGRVHVNQKPVALMHWCIVESPVAIVDPYAGSGATLLAAKDLGIRCVGIEIEERYCEIAAQRLSQEVLAL